MRKEKAEGNMYEDMYGINGPRPIAAFSWKEKMMKEVRRSHALAIKMR